MTGLKPSAVAGALILPMFAGGAWALSHVGSIARVPIHFDIHGRPNNYAPAWIGLFALPAIACLVWLLPMLLPRIDPRGQNVQRSGRAVGTIVLASIVVLAAAQAMIVAATLGLRVDTTHLIGVLVGGMFIVMGNVFGKLRWNYTVGIRTPWTLADERVWDQTHRFGGWVFVLGGIVLATASCLTPVSLMAPTLVAITSAIVLLPILKSYLLWQRMRS